jgi:hypothetical protein
MAQKRLNNLFIITTENDIMDSINYIYFQMYIDWVNQNTQVILLII